MQCAIKCLELPLKFLFLITNFSNVTIFSLFQRSLCFFLESPPFSYIFLKTLAKESG